jgi:hypothetical protein
LLRPFHNSPPLHACLRTHRLLADESPATQEVARAYNIVEVPTFVFLRSGREVARHVGSSRGDLIGKILQVRVGGWVDEVERLERCVPRSLA